MSTLSFPEGFVWGAATAAYQIEGAAHSDGRSPSIWDSYLAARGYRGDTGDIAADHYHRLDQDLDLLADLGVSSYRFSVSWSRVIPDNNRINQTGLDFYRRLVDGLHTRNITPALTMYHMDLPERFSAAGGWSSRETALRFADYADLLTREFGDSVPFWMTVNELYYESWMGYCEGTFPPGHRSARMGAQALHHMLLAHGHGVAAVRKNTKTASVGLVTGYAPTEPATEHPDDIAAAHTVHTHANGSVLSPVLRGTYPNEYAHHPSRYEALNEVILPGDLATIGTPVDFIGINYYFKRHIASLSRINNTDLVRQVDPPGEWLRLRHLQDIGATEVRPKSETRTMAGWTPDASGLTDSLLQITREYGEINLFVTENGLPLPDYVNPNGKINDIERVIFIREHLVAVHEAIREGAQVKGYFAWSLMDNLEWTAGFGHRFGLIFVDFATQKRIPKTSFSWYRQVSTSNNLN
ncbi:family 1 glycosylhydrolase [Lysinibacter sp. HNR]|uniref:glycoside hydrolase family 1 protein n=1 Tax=Lysinibacter sp. HNR TaxID=3031408 RepID=UPI00243603F0|nr:family 1 glycosylhydrolase [Lysinibacter sp. HNR]WGD38180.1 family 1 glycosylhydrolase [Lysinibacter sp. HNR]